MKAKKKRALLFQSSYAQSDCNQMIMVSSSMQLQVVVMVIQDHFRQKLDFYIQF